MTSTVTRRVGGDRGRTSRPDRVVVFGANAYGAGLPLGDVQLARAFVRRGLPVHFVDPARNPLRSRHRHAATTSRPDDPGVVRPALLSGRPGDLGRAVLDRAVVHQVNRHLPAGDDVLAVVTHPGWGALDGLRVRKYLYWQRDLYLEHQDDASSGWLARRHLEALRRADVATGVSDAIRARNLTDGVTSTVVPNGVELGHWDRPACEPEDIADLPRPRAVVCGAWTWRVDPRFVFALARAVPALSIVVVGNGDDFPTDRPANVRALGRRAYEDLPGYLQHADVGLVPYASHRFNTASSPLKISEYLASGLPVVAANVDVPTLDGVVREDDPDRWAAAVAAVLASGLGAAARSAVEANTWDARATTVLRALGYAS